MLYFKVGAGKFVEFDDMKERARVIIRAELVEQKRLLQERIATADPNQPKTNAEWIAWAKANYPYVDHSAEQAELERIETILDAIKAL